MVQRRTDLAVEAHQLWREQAGETTKLPGVRAEEGETEGFSTTRVTILDREGAAALGKPVGQYLTIELDGLLRREQDSFQRAVRAVAALLEPMLPPQGLALVAGLGNRAITPDLVGPLAADRTLATRHLVEQLADMFGHLRPVAVLTPGVLASTGVESGLLVQAAVEQLRPACVVAVDALASRSAQRLCRTVQLSDAGIVPGSGVGNHRLPLDAHHLGVPVISLGVPTVVEASTLALDLVGEGHSGPLPGADLFVTPREVDSQVADLGRVIGFGVSMALNPSLSVDELTLLLE